MASRSSKAAGQAANRLRAQDEELRKSQQIAHTPGAQDLDYGTRRDFELEQQLENKMAQREAMDAPQASRTQVADAPTLATREQQFRQGQAGLIQALQNQAMGRGPSLAQNQLRQATDRTLSQTLAAQAAQRGTTGGLAARNVADRSAQIRQQAAGQSADLALQEQLAARQQLAGVLAQARGQDQAYDTTQAQIQQKSELLQAQLDNQTALANLNAQMRSQEAMDAMTQFYMSQGMALNEAQRQADMFADQLALQERQGFLDAATAEQLAVLQQYAQERGQDKAFNANLIAGIIGGAGSVVSAGAAAAASDKNLKENIKPLTASDKTMETMRRQQAIQQQGQNMGLLALLPKPTGGQSVVAEGAGRLLGPSAAAAMNTVESNRARLQGGKATATQRGFGIKSDKNDKQNKDQYSDNFLNALKAYSYEYKEPEKYGEGKQIGVMAQDLEKTQIGKQMVEDTPEGKMVDYGKGFGAMLASMVQQNERINQLENELNQLRRRKK